jgi:tRNA threonylcarbamoyladenosine biosynthesis protein TsaB
MPLILSLETSTRVCSVALHSEVQLLASFEVLVEKSHSKIITVLIEQLLSNAGYSYSDLDAIAVSKGPGSYTGLRIGVSTAKGLCYALEKPLIGINTLQAMAEGVKSKLPSDFLLCPMLDARRMEVYTALFDHQLNFMENTNAKVLNEESVKIYQGKKICFLGDGSFKINSILTNLHSSFIADGIYPSAKNIGSLAIQAFSRGEFEDTAYFEPYYLKDFVSKV